MSPLVDAYGQPIGPIETVDDTITAHTLAREISRLAAMLPAATVTSTPGHVILQLTPVQLFTIVAMVQLAMRHPQTSDFHHAVAEGFVDAALDVFAECPAVRDVIRRGNDPAEDGATLDG